MPRLRPVLPDSWRRAATAICAAALATALVACGAMQGAVQQPAAPTLQPRVPTTPPDAGRATVQATLVGGDRLPAPARSAVEPGIVVLVRDSAQLLRGKRVGLITNHTGVANGTSSIDLLARLPGTRLTALFGPEHGIRGAAEAGVTVASGVDAATGVRIHSLYGATRVPTPAMLREVDVLVYDIQDVGARVYTYPWTMALAADAAAKAGIPFIVCDRPVPVGGDVVQGGVLDTAFRSFVGQYPVALRYGLTQGELLRHLVRTKQVRSAGLHVIPVRGWTRAMWYDETGLPWIAPSPNLRTLDAATVYGGTVFFEGTNLSEGRGTDAPFQLVGAPWLQAAVVVADLRALALPGLAFDTATRTIAAGQKHAGLTIPMVRITVTDRRAVQAPDLGAWMLQVIRRRHPAQFTWRAEHMDRLAGTDELRHLVDRGDDAALRDLLARWRSSAAAFARATEPDRLYR
ncbi:MAG: DUF1343 domain-containing protein [Gemmatimonadaceae bacterium]|jgi:uncharacterized protein YbbC (DUF1343 family)|nr:DUF1343 domain-containing protein [Gemmatimonadaceae bacterium]